MAVRTFGEIVYEDKEYLLRVEPHVAIMLKAIFPQIPKTQTGTLKIKDKEGIASELIWFMDRYPLKISEECTELLKRDDQLHKDLVAKRESILLPDYVPTITQMKKPLRPYQEMWVDFIDLSKRGLNADWAGLGKTPQALGLAARGKLPMAIFVKKHLKKQWVEKILEFTDLRPHIVRTRKAYNLPLADIFIFTYGKAVGWVDLFQTGFFKAVVYDEIQELRRDESVKYKACRVASKNAEYSVGLSATPVQNYAIDIYNVLDLISPGCLGDRGDFVREWFGYGKITMDPDALGSFIKEKHLMVRRTRADVGRDLPPTNIINDTVETDEKAYESHTAMAKTLATRALHGRFDEAGRSLRELDIMVRQATGIAKAKGVAEYVKILLESGEQVVLFGWHRKVYEIWLEELKDFAPAMYTGTESEAQKKKNADSFIRGESRVLIMSLASGEGLDGLQHLDSCSTVVFGELDWSGEKHKQCIWRVERDGSQKQTTAIFLTCDEGSDPPMVELLGLKAAQAKGVMDPGKGPERVHSDDSRLKMLAKAILAKKTGQEESDD